MKRLTSSWRMTLSSNEPPTPPQNARFEMTQMKKDTTLGDSDGDISPTSSYDYHKDPKWLRDRSKRWLVSVFKEHSDE